jgi:radical SAM protein with 4Fe4S-binding SPASM domain
MENNLPTILEFQLTLDCQYNCAYCGNIKNNTQYSEPTFEQITNILDCVKPSKVSFTGGEPTLKWDLLLRLIEYSASRGITTQINTNGGLLNRDKILEMEGLGLKNLHISLSTLNSRRYQAMRRIRDSGALKHMLGIIEFANYSTSLKVIPETLLLKSNLHEIENIYSLMSSLGVDEFEIQNIIPTDPKMWKLIPNDNDIISTLKKVFSRQVASTKIILCCLHLTSCYGFPDFLSIDGVDLYKCVCGREGAYISVTGDVYPCSFFHNSIGNAFIENIFEIWRKSDLISSIQNELPTECKTCNSFEKCRNACMAVTYNKHGRFNKRSYPIYTSELSSKSE